jgi:hypothetical protein
VPVLELKFSVKKVVAMSRRSSIAFLVAVVISMLALANGSDILALDAKAYQKSVLDSHDPWVVFFYDSTMVSDEDAMEDMLDKLEGSAIKPYGIGYGKVDCADIKGNRATRKLCQSAGLATIPAVGFVTEKPEINPYTNKMGRAVKLHTGDPTDVKKIERSLIARNYPAEGINSIKSTSGDIQGELDDLLEQASNDGKKYSLVFFASKDNVSLFTKSICQAFSLGDIVACTTVGGMSGEEITERFALGEEPASVPSLMVVPHSSGDGDSKAVLYPLSQSLESSSDRDRDHVINWVTELTGFDASSAAKAAGEEEEGAGDSSNSKGKKDKKKADSGESAALAGLSKYSTGDFQEDSLAEDRAWVVLVSQSGHDTLEEEHLALWKKLAQATEGVVDAAELLCGAAEDSSSAVSKVLCGARALPYMAMVPFGDSDDRADVFSAPVKKSHLYDLADAGKAKSAALNSLPDDINYIGEAEIEPFMSLNLQAGRMGLLVLSDKTEAPAMLRNVKRVLDSEDLANVGFLSEPSSGFLSQLGLPADVTMPAVFMMHVARETPEGTPEGHHATSLTPFETSVFGRISFNSIMTFTMNVYHQSGYAQRRESRSEGGDANSASGSGDDPFAGLSGGEAALPVHITNNAEWESECGTSFKGICVLAFTKAGAEDDVAQINTAVLAKLGRSAAAFKFLVFDGPCQLSFAERFDVHYDSMPAYSIYSPSKGRSAAFREGLSAEKVSSFLDSVLGGRATTFAVPQRPSLSDTCEMDEAELMNGAAGGAGYEEEEPMDDFLEEIRREEAEKAALLKKELAQEAKKAKEEAKAAKEAAKSAPKKVKKVVKKVKKKKSEL